MFKIIASKRPALCFLCKTDSSKINRRPQFCPEPLMGKPLCAFETPLIPLGPRVSAGVFMHRGQRRSVANHSLFFPFLLSSLLFCLAFVSVFLSCIVWLCICFPFACSPFASVYFCKQTVGFIQFPLVFFWFFSSSNLLLNRPILSIYLPSPSAVCDLFPISSVLSCLLDFSPPACSTAAAFLPGLKPEKLLLFHCCWFYSFTYLSSPMK